MIAQTRALPENVERIIAGRRQRIREKLYHLDAPQENSTPADLLLHGVLKDIDEATMSCSFVVSTQDVDRSGEIVETAGIRTESHKLNPVAMWDHGRGPIGRVPIGKFEDEAGNYTVVVRPHEGIAVGRLYFSRTLAFARDLFLLIKEGCLRGASIGFRTLDAEPMPGHHEDEEDPPLHYREVELCEISPTSVPDNARSLAIRKAFEGRKPSREMEMVVKTWEESSHPRDHGKFASAATDSAHGASDRSGDAKAKEHAAKAKKASDEGDHAAAAHHHHEAAGAHARMAIEADQDGGPGESAMRKHDSATEAHRNAAKAHLDAMGDGHAKATAIAHSMTKREVDNAKPGTFGHEMWSGIHRHSQLANEASKRGDHATAAQRHRMAAARINKRRDYSYGDERTQLTEHRDAQLAAARAHEEAAEKTKEKSMTQTGNKTAKKVLGKSFLDDLKSLNEPGIAALSKALSTITGKGADDYLQMDEEGKLGDDTLGGKDGKDAASKDGMNSTSIDAGGAATPVDTTKEGDAPAEDMPAYKQPLDGPPSQAAATDLHTQLGAFAETIEGWASRQENEKFKDVLERLADMTAQAMGEVSGFHDEAHPDHEPLGATAEEQKAADEDEALPDDEDPEDEAKTPEQKEEAKAAKARRLKLKAAPFQRLAKRIKAFRAKSARAKAKVVDKRLGKAAVAAVAKAVAFLEKAEGHTGEWSETHKAASGFHKGVLRQLTGNAPAAADDTLEIKRLRDERDKAVADAKAARELAETAVEQAERVTKAYRKYKAGQPV